MKLVALVLLATSVPVLAMGVYLLRRNGDILTEKARESLSFALARRAAQVDEWLSDRVRELGRWSSSFVLYEGLPALRGKGVTTSAIITRMRLRHRAMMFDGSPLSSQRTPARAGKSCSLRFSKGYLCRRSLSRETE